MKTVFNQRPTSEYAQVLQHLTNKKEVSSMWTVGGGAHVCWFVGVRDPTPWIAEGKCSMT